MTDTIKSIKAYEILNAKGNPTVEVEIQSKQGFEAIASVPSGTSTGSYEAFVLTDNEKRFYGKGMRKAVNNVNNIIAPALIGKYLENLSDIDRFLLDLDGTPNKSKLGANAILPVSVACAKVIAKSMNRPLYTILSERKEFSIPNIIATVIAGGKHGVSGLEFEDYLYIFHDFPKFSDQLEALVILRKELEKVLIKEYGLFPEDGGALAAPIKSSEEAFKIMLQVIHEQKYDEQVSLGLDVAASELMDIKNNKYKIGQGTLTNKELNAYYLMLAQKYPLDYLEDGFHEDDVEGFALLQKSSIPIQNVGDDLYTSNITRLKKYYKYANGLLLKINQIGTVTEAIDASNFAQSKGMDVTVSLRSGETNDDFIADLAVAIGAKQIKLGSPVRLERNVKYNRLLKIEAELNKQ